MKTRNFTHWSEACVVEMVSGKRLPSAHHDWNSPCFQEFSAYHSFDQVNHITSLSSALINQMPAGVMQEWVRVYKSKSLPSWDFTTDLAIDRQGNVYVTGYSTNMPQGMDFCTIKYDRNGNQLWVNYFNGESNGDDIAWKIALDSDDNVYVGGTSIGMETGFDFVVVKYNSQGQQQWVAR